MNPCRWRRDHQIAWGVFAVVGALGGTLLGWVWSPFSHSQGAGALFLMWLQYPSGYWPLATSGFVIGALIFYGTYLVKH